jgi:hypothetical protein
MDLVNYQCAIEAYISDVGNLCLVINSDDLVEIDNKEVLIINHENVERFVLGLSSLLEEIQHG